MNDETLTTAERELIEMAEADLKRAQLADVPKNTAGAWQVVYRGSDDVLATYLTRAKARAAVKSANAVENAQHRFSVRKRPEATAAIEPVKNVTKTKRTKKNVKVPKSVNNLSKKVQALNIYHAAVKAGEATRKNVLPRLMSELGLSKPGASTYFQNMKSGKWS